MRVTFVRHGETEQNKFKIYGDPMKGDLSELGRGQAKKLAKRLSKERFDIIYCSPSTRTKETLGEIIKFHQNTPIVYTSELRELEVGGLIGKIINVEDLRKLGKNFANFKPEGGESRLDLMNRVSNFLDYLFKKHKGEHMLLVTHAGVSRIIKNIAENKLPEFISIDVGKQNNCAVNILEFNKKGKPKLWLYNCTKHLK
ncbi:MAG TPA: histidine phosphatase family protein [Candidatus Paceibacterota bacterium]|nr:histidine phosphatase family protein [Candidatus Paceibacterota bacterium]